jgi:bifunctional DNase/RNase
MKKIKLDVFNIQPSNTQSGAYALILEESRGRRRIPIIIGVLEAQAIAIEKEKIKPNRPLTHDLFKPISSEFGIHFTEVIIYNLVEGVFYAKILCNNGEREIELDSRTSDAIAIALRFNCPIYTYEFIINSVGIAIDDEDTNMAVDSEDDYIEKEELAEPVNIFSKYTNTQLTTMLQEALDAEDYEKATNIRDEINARKNQ